MTDTLSDATGAYSFAGLAAGTYRVTPGYPGLSFVPANIEIQIDGTIAGANFYAYLTGSRAPAEPAAPIKIAGAAPHSISGMASTPTGAGLVGMTFTLDALGALDDPPPADYEEPPLDIEPGLRIVPPGLLAHKQSARQHTCFCWAIKPVNGDWEGYTSLPESITLPEYETLPGDDGSTATIPALEYVSGSGVLPTAIPTRLGLGKDGVDVTVLAFDRDKLLSNYYRGAEFIVFEVDYRSDLSERLPWLAGVLGNAQVGDLSATIELVPWPDLANRTLGRTAGVLCDVGRLVEYRNLDGTPEEFGAGRCRNEVLEDGPLKADWTVLTTITAVTSRAAFRLSYGALAISGAALHTEFAEHLAAGKVLGLDGDNAGFTREVKSGSLISAGVVDVALHVPLPHLPAAGETVNLTAGCRKTASDCKFYGNYDKNFRGFDTVPGRENVIRRFTG